MNIEMKNLSENEYSDILSTAINQIQASRNAIAAQINTAANSTYWNLGKLLHDRKIEGGYGSNIINRLSIDLKSSFPDMGLSPRNLWNMKLFYERYANSDKKLLQAVAVLQWGHNLLMINKKLSDEEAYYYATESVLKNWNRNLLLNAIKMDSFSLNKNAFRDNNFSKTLPALQASQANEILKDRYNLGFLGLTEPVAELYFVDLLFSNRKLNCLVAIDLKIGEFKSEYVGKMNMYLSLLDKIEKEENENQSIGIILCAEKDHLDVELALQDINKPIAVSDYELLVPKKELQTLVLNEMKQAQIADDDKE
ncbi:PDDEXK nuclease domain-containing protein [Treponema berlinense]|uniref:PDDEXK nuclease domain-containing protein n=1 Tax=Treponema berlinense TaxID=225004 RepID=UPI0026F164CD|nr:PDDEXK nuclease domain-containing protein [Treponema berlinense]